MNTEEFARITRLQINTERYAPFKELNEKEVKECLTRLYEYDPLLKSSDLPPGFYRMVTKYFGGLKDARKELSLSSPKKTYTYIKTEKRKQADLDKIKWTNDVILEKAKDAVDRGLCRNDFYKENKGVLLGIKRIYSTMDNFENITGIKFYKKPPKYSDAELTQFVLSAVGKGLSGAKAKEENPRLYAACFKKWGNWNNSLIANGFEPANKSPRKDWTKEELAEIYLKEIESGVQKRDTSNHAAIRKLFGGLIELQKYLGIYEEETQYELLSKISIDCYINQALKMDVDNISEQLLDELDVNLTYSIKHHYGSTSNYFSILDIDRYKKPYTSFTWTKENIVWQLERWIREGYPVNYTAIQSRHKGIIVASRRLFGSYKKAFEYAGLNYDDYRIDTAMASRQGAEFENVVAEILTDLGIEYLREPSINGCHPDFVIGEHWIDAKLSEWTVSFADCSTIHKYTPHCRRLTIVYLRKLKDETIRTNELGIDMIHVSELLKELPEDKAYDYQRKLDAILDVLKENAA